MKISVCWLNRNLEVNRNHWHHNGNDRFIQFDLLPSVSILGPLEPLSGSRPEALTASISRLEQEAESTAVTKQQKGGEKSLLKGRRPWSWVACLGSKVNHRETSYLDRGRARRGVLRQSELLANFKWFWYKEGACFRLNESKAAVNSETVVLWMDHMCMWRSLFFHGLIWKKLKKINKKATFFITLFQLRIPNKMATAGYRPQMPTLVVFIFSSFLARPPSVMVLMWWKCPQQFVKHSVGPAAHPVPTALTQNKAFAICSGSL